MAINVLLYWNIEIHFFWNEYVIMKQKATVGAMSHCLNKWVIESFTQLIQLITDSLHLFVQ